MPESVVHGSCLCKSLTGSHGEWEMLLLTDQQRGEVHLVVASDVEDSIWGYSWTRSRSSWITTIISATMCDTDMKLGFTMTMDPFVYRSGVFPML